MLLSNITPDSYEIRTAWRVDFNMSLSTFEPLFGGLRDLIDLALKSPHPTPPRLLFASSISIFSSKWPNSGLFMGLTHANGRLALDHASSRDTDR